MICGFNESKDAKDHYDDIGKTNPSKFHITRRDIKTVVDLELILRSVKVSKYPILEAFVNNDGLIG